MGRTGIQPGKFYLQGQIVYFDLQNLSYRAIFMMDKMCLPNRFSDGESADWLSA